MTVEAVKLKKEYKLGESVKVVNDDIDLVVRQGDFIGLKGKSGCGKSTFLNMLCGMLKPTSGDVLYDGVSILSKSDAETALLRNEKIGYVMQDICLLPNYSVLDNVLLPNYMFKREHKYALGRANGLLESMGISWAANSFPQELSGGEMRRVAIARAMINSPEILIFDEATNDLDEETEAEIMRLLKRLNAEGLTVLMVSHRSANIEYAGAVYEMENGKLARLR